MRNLRPIDVTLIWTCLGDDAAGHLTEYFHSGMYSGAHFERFAGGGDRKATADQFTSDDIVAVSMLSVRIPGKAALALLQRDPDKVNALLAAIPQEVDLWNVDEAAIAPGSPADQLWTALEATPGIGWVTANKLLARKRPRLIPVYDSVVRDALARHDSDELWRPLRSMLRDHPAIIERLRELRDLTGLVDSVSLLRTLDVAMWMHAYGRPEPVPDSES